MRTASRESLAPLLGPPPNFILFKILLNTCGLGLEGGARRRQSKFSRGKATNERLSNNCAVHHGPQNTLPPPPPLKDFKKGSKKHELKSKTKSRESLKLQSG